MRWMYQITNNIKIFLFQINMTVCLVAGAGPGIGQSVAKRFIKEGFTVIAVRRSEDKIKPFEVEMNKCGKIS